jgi:tellurite resistance protein
LNSAEPSPRRGKILSCVLLPDVLCSFRKSEKSTIMDRCWKCPHFKKFEQEMAEEDQRVMDAIDEERRRGAEG